MADDPDDRPEMVELRDLIQAGIDSSMDGKTPEDISQWRKWSEDVFGATVPTLNVRRSEKNYKKASTLFLVVFHPVTECHGKPDGVEG